MRTPRATLLGFGGLAILATAASAAAPCALPVALAGLLALAGALLVVEFTFSRPVLKFCGGVDADSSEALARLKAWLPATLRAEREAIEDEARWRSDVRAAISAKTATAEARKAREALAEPIALALRALAEGDLTKRMDAPELARDYEAAVALYNKTVFALGSSATAIGARAREITGEAQALGERAEILGWNASPAREALRAVAEQGDGIAKYRRDAEQAVVNLRGSTKAAHTALAAGAESMEQIVGARSKIDEIADSIDGYVFQLRLVAVNAGVEAARAGDKGRGGAVVAKELRTLSEKTAAATFQLTRALSETMDAVGGAAKALRSAASAAEREAAAVPALEDSAPTRAPLREIEAALDALAEATTRDAKSAEDISAASLSLETLVSKLAALASHFRYAGAESVARAEPEVATETPAPLSAPAPRALPAPRAVSPQRMAARRLRAI